MNSRRRSARRISRRNDDSGITTRRCRCGVVVVVVLLIIFMAAAVARKWRENEKISFRVIVLGCMSWETKKMSRLIIVVLVVVSLSIPKIAKGKVRKQ